MKTKSDVSLPQRGQEMSLGDRISFVPSHNSRCPPSSFLLQQYSPYTAGFYCILKFIIGSLDRPKRFKYSFKQSQCLDLERQFLRAKCEKNQKYRIQMYDLCIVASNHLYAVPYSSSICFFTVEYVVVVVLYFCLFLFYQTKKMNCEST